MADINGTSASEVINGTDESDIIDGLGGGDTITALGGDDRIVGNADGSTIDGGMGVDTLDYRTFGGVAQGGVVRGVIVNLVSYAHFGEGGDTLSNIENIDGSLFNDDITGGKDDNILNGYDGDDRFVTVADDVTSFGVNTVDGGAGIDTIDYSDLFPNSQNGGIKVNLTLGTGNTIIAIDQYGYPIHDGLVVDDTLISIENIVGSVGHDDLTGDTKANVIDGGAGNDVFHTTVGTDHDRFVGGLGFDTVNFAAETAGVTVTLNAGYSIADSTDIVDPVTGEVISVAAGTGEREHSFEGIENIEGSLHNDIIVGDNGNNRFNGDAGVDVLSGLDGDDILIGSAGNDRLFGGAGDDIIGTDLNATPIRANIRLYEAGDDYIDAGAGDDIVNAGTGNDRVYGRSGDDEIYGDAGDDLILGGAGEDYINGGSGTDFIIGGAGNDFIEGGYGTDNIYGGLGDDLIYGGAEDGGDATARVRQDWAGEGFTVELNGNATNGVLYGGIGRIDDIIYGQEGKDTIYGGGDRDVLFGDTSNAGVGDDDELHGGNSNDVLFGLQGNDTLFGDSNSDLLSGYDGDDTLNGGSGSDLLFAGAGNDVLNGGEHNDWLFANSGNNILTGGPSLELRNNKDTFIFVAGDGQNVITDFTTGEDVVDLSSFANLTFADLDFVLVDHDNDVGTADVVQMTINDGDHAGGLNVTFEGVTTLIAEDFDF